ncbi:DUF11 domain-containing protein, partial [candidate division KSB1 bacterium]|nr:DUF11 domain-containing protein [candidate division KSB1 bacterium]
MKKQSPGMLVVLLLVLMLGAAPQVLAQDDIDVRMKLESLTCDPVSDTGELIVWLQSRSTTPEMDSYDLVFWQNALRLDQALTDNLIDVTFSDIAFEGVWQNDMRADKVPASSPTHTWIQIVCQGTLTSTWPSPAHNDWWDVLKMTIRFNLSAELANVQWYPDPMPPIYGIRGLDPANPSTTIDLTGAELDEITNIPLNCSGELGSVGKPHASYFFNSGVRIGTNVTEETTETDPFPETANDGVTPTPFEVAFGSTSFAFSVSTTVPSASYLMAWVDWNNDGDMDDANETAVEGPTAVASGTQSTGFTFSIPAGQAAGNYWVRLRLANSADPLDVSEALGDIYVEGEIQDHQLVVQAPGEVDLTLEKVASVSEMQVDDQVVFTLTVTNASPIEAQNVSVTDVLPYGFTYLSDNGAGSYNPSTGIWSITSIPANGSASLQITARAFLAATLENCAEITASSPAFNPALQTQDCATVDVGANDSDLGLSKEVDPQVVAVDDIVTYTLRVHNYGPNPVTGFSVDDNIDLTMLQYVSDDGGGSYNPTTGVWTFSSTLAVGAEAVLNIQMRTLRTGTYTNIGQIVSATPMDNNPFNNLDWATLNIGPGETDVEIEKTVSPASGVQVGDEIVYTLTVRNTSGSVTANTVTVFDFLPGQVTFISSTGDGTYNPSTHQWTGIGPIAPGGSKSIDIRVRVGARGVITNCSHIIQVQPTDMNLDDNHDCVSITIGPKNADLQVQKQVVPSGPVDEGSSVVYTVTLTNAGPDAAEWIQVYDLLPAGLRYQSHTLTPSGTSSYDPQTGIWDVPTLSGANGTITLAITAEAQAAGTWVNCARVIRSDSNDPDFSNNVGCVPLQVNATYVDISLSKTPASQSVQQGAQGSFVLTVTNTGNADAGDLVVTDTWPAGLTYVSHDPASADFALVGGNYVWTIGDLAGNNGSVQLTVTFMASGAIGAHINQLCYTSSTPTDPEPPQCAEATVTITQGAEVNIELSKTPASMTVAPGEAGVFTLRVSNTGTADATNVVVTDIWPSGLNYISHEPAGESFTLSGTDYVWNVGALNGGGAFKELLVNFTAGSATGDVVNQLCYTSSNPLDPEPPECVTSTVTISEGPKFTDPEDFTKDDGVASGTAVNPGDEITYTITVHNSGDQAGTNVQ